MRLPNDLRDGDRFEASLIEIYGADIAGEIIASMAYPSAPCYWVNPLVAGDFAVIGSELEGLRGLFVTESAARVSELEAAIAGRIYLQNPSSYLAALVLDPQPNEEVLDLAAAPGSKTVAMAALMSNTGRIAAVEPIKARFHRLRANLNRCGVTNVQLYQRDGRGVGRAVGERFDRVLLDAPCSSEARMLWGEPQSYRHWSARKVKESQRKQKALIRSAYQALKPGGVLLYSTCSFALEENEGVVQHLIGKTDACVESIAGVPRNVIPGRGDLLRNGARELERTIRIVPDGVWEGFYLARLRKPD